MGPADSLSSRLVRSYGSLNARNASGIFRVALIALRFVCACRFRLWMILPSPLPSFRLWKGKTYGQSPFICFLEHFRGCLRSFFGFGCERRFSCRLVPALSPAQGFPPGFCPGMFDFTCGRFCSSFRLWRFWCCCLCSLAF